MAQQAIDAIHGQHTLPNASEPLVVRWADAPGSRKRDGREGGRKRGTSGGGLGKGDLANGWAPMMGMGMGWNGAGSFPQMQPMQQMVVQQQPGLMGGGFGGNQFYGGQPSGNSFYGGSLMGYPPQMMAYMGQAGIMGGWQQQQQPGLAWSRRV